MLLIFTVVQWLHIFLHNRLESSCYGRRMEGNQLASDGDGKSPSGSVRESINLVFDLMDQGFSVKRTIPFRCGVWWHPEIE